MDKEKAKKAIEGMRSLFTIAEAALTDFEIACGLREPEPDKIKEMQDLFPRLQKLAMEKSRQGFTDKVHEMITKRGFKKLSEVGCIYFKEMIEELEALK